MINKEYECEFTTMTKDIIVLKTFKVKLCSNIF